MATGNPFTSAQAPASMQMLAPDIAAQQTQLARQQQMADILRQQSMTPLGGTDVVGGWAVKKSPLEGIAKLAQALAAGSMQGAIDDKQLGLAKAMQQRMGDSFSAMAGGAPSALPGGAAAGPGTPAPTQPDQAGGAPQDGAPNPVAPAQAPQQMGQVERIRNQARAAYMMGNHELANKLLENISTLTNEQRNMIAMGQDPMLMGQLATAAAKKAGIIELQPGTTALDLSNGQERFQPKVGEGISLNNGQASAIPGYAGASAEIAGANAGAVSGANAAHEMVTVNTPAGPVMMTKAQAVQMSGGAPAPAQGGTHFDNPAPGGMSLNFKGNPQAVFDQLSKLPEPHRTEALQAFSQYAAQPAPATRGGQIGIPLKTPAQEAADMAKVQLESAPGIDMKKKEFSDMADYGKALNGRVSDSQALLQRIGQSREALTKFRAGGGGEISSNLASMAQALHLPTSVVDMIAGGDLSASQEFQKYAAQEALGTMQQALASDTGKGAQGNRISMQLFIKNNPNIDTDPRAIEKIFNFQTMLHNQVKEQADAYQKYKDTPGNDPSKFPNWWASEAINRGFVTPEIKSGYAKGVSVPPNVQAVLDKYK